MTYDRSREIKKIEEMRNSGNYPIVNLTIFDTVRDLQLDDYTLEREQELIDRYKEYLNTILSIKLTPRKKYLKTIKLQEIIDTQMLEKEDSYSIAQSLQDNDKSAIDYLVKAQRFPNTTLTKRKIVGLNKKILTGTQSSIYTKYDYREDDTSYVVKRVKGEPTVHYFSLPCSDIEEGIMNLTLYYNGNLHEEYTLLKPMIIQGLVGSLQMFYDGNTRSARTLQSVKLYELTEKNLKKYFPNPPIYISSSYLHFRDQYRQKIGEIAINPNDETWIQWLNFNLNRFEDQLYYMNDKLGYYTKSLKY